MSKSEWYAHSMSGSVLTSMRLEDDARERADSILATLRGDPRLIGIKLTRSAVIRAAIARGLAQLEAECGE